ncbi:MAG: PP2C family protein-serine/threonine phosphatase, partial [Rhodothermales bacterium]|nr:PP2C family protein-serine/threonine phosphatase [Rhodothermales bacterium]
FMPEFGGWRWQVLFFVGIGGVTFGALIGLLVFVASAASDALARSVTPAAVETLTLARRVLWINAPVGRALLRGTALAFVLVGFGAAALALFASAPLPHADDALLFGWEQSLWLFGSAVAGAGWSQLFLLLASLVAVGALLERWRPAAVVPGLTLVLVLLQVEPVRLPVDGLLVTWGPLAALALLIAAAYRRYDALTLLVALVLAKTLWETAGGFVVAASPAWPDAALAFGLAGAAVVVGAVGVRSRRDGRVLPRYEPDYVVEQRERGRLQRELEIAREVQRSFLPARMPAVEGLDIAARCVPAAEVGGDYYDLVPLDEDRLALVIGDVSGKGIQAAFFMTLAKGLLQTLAHEVDAPAEVLRRLNRHFCANAPRGTFISLVYGVFDLQEQTFTFVRAGHNPVLLRRDGRAEALQPPGLAIGLTSGPTFDEAVREETVRIQPGDAVVVYTDGLSEAMDATRALYSDGRLAATVAGAAEGSAADLLRDVLADVRAYAGPDGLHDDLTMVVVRVAEPAPGDGQARTEISTPSPLP